MKALQGFSPLTAAVFLVAALVLPVVLFPFGAALLMNIVYVVGYREYLRSKTTKFFQLSVAVLSLNTIIMILLFLLVPFLDLFLIVRDHSFLRIFIRSEIPDNLDLKILMINFYGFFLVANPVTVYFFLRILRSSADRHAKSGFPDHNLQIPYVLLPLALTVLGGVKLIYLSGAKFDPVRSSAAPVEGFESIIFITTFASCFYSSMRIYYRVHLNRRF